MADMLLTALLCFNPVIQTNDKKYKLPPFLFLNLFRSQLVLSYKGLKRKRIAENWLFAVKVYCSTEP